MCERDAAGDSKGPRLTEPHGELSLLPLAGTGDSTEIHLMITLPLGDRSHFLLFSQDILNLGFLRNEN